MMKDSAVEGFNHCFATGGDRVLLFLELDDWIGSAGEFRFEFHSEFKNLKLSSVTIHDWNGIPHRWMIASLSMSNISARLW